MLNLGVFTRRNGFWTAFIRWGTSLSECFHYVAAHVCFEYCDSSSTGPPQTNKLKDPVTRHSPSRKASWYTRDTAGTKLMRKYDALSVVRTVRNYTSFIIYYQKPIRDWNVLLICLLCPMLANGIHFQKYHIWNETTRSSNSKFLSSWILKNCTEVQERKKKVVVLGFRLPQNGKLGSFTS